MLVRQRTKAKVRVLGLARRLGQRMTLLQGREREQELEMGKEKGKEKGLQRCFAKRQKQKLGKALMR